MTSVKYLVYKDICLTQLILDKFTKMAPEFTERLQSIWKQMGISTSSQHDRVDAVMNYIQELLSDMVADEENLLKELIKNTEKHRDELLNVGQTLGLPPYEPNETLSLVEKEKDLRTTLDAWNLEKHERMKTYKELREKEDVLCKRLALPNHETSITEIPTAAYLKEIEANINYMENELMHAEIQFDKVRESICKLWDELEVDIAENPFWQIASEEAKVSFVLSKDNLKQLKEHQNELEKQQEDDRQLGVELFKRLKSLWVKLEIPEKDQCAFTKNCIGSRPSAIRKLKDEVDKYECMKWKYTKKFILASRKELIELWDKCFFGESERNMFTPAFDDTFTEELLKMHEHQVSVMHGYYEDNKAIFKLVKKRELMWDKLMEFENREDDPSRLFTNRGGALLKELREKNAVEKGLPKVEEDLKAMIPSWENENENLFLFYGSRYLELIKSQQEDRKRKKQLAKLGKEKTKKEKMTKELVFGSKPVATVKRANSIIEGKRKRGYQNNSSSSNSGMSTQMLSHYNFPVPRTIKKKTRRISCKIKKHPFRSHKRCDIESGEDTSTKEDDDSVHDDSNQYLVSYPDFTNHLEKNREHKLSSTATIADSSESINLADDQDVAISPPDNLS